MRTAKTPLPFLARLALIVLIQCPLPVFHAHGVTAAELSSIPSLPEHVRRFHEATDRSKCETLGWHLHVLPPLGMPGDQRGDDQAAPDVDLPWRSDSDSDTTGSQLVRDASEPAAVHVGIALTTTRVVCFGRRPCDTFGEITRRQRLTILRA